MKYFRKTYRFIFKLYSRNKLFLVFKRKIDEKKMRSFMAKTLFLGFNLAFFFRPLYVKQLCTH